MYSRSVAFDHQPAAASPIRTSAMARPAEATAGLCRRAHLAARFDSDGRRASTGRSIEEPPQVLGQFARRGVTLGRILRQGLEDDLLEVQRDHRIAFPRRDRLFEADLPQDRLAVLAVVGRDEGQELVEGGPQCVDVGTVVDQPPRPQDLFGAHVPERPDHVAAGRQVAVAADPGQAEIGDPEVAPFVHEQVRGLDVPVQHLVAVREVERLGRLLAQPGHLAGRQAALALAHAAAGSLRPGAAPRSASWPGRGSPDPLRRR